MTNVIKAPISVGELLDKISILEIKEKNTNDINKLSNINKELFELKSLYYENNLEIEKLYQELKKINQILWDVEDSIRIKEKEKIFDSSFIELARSVYKNNDIRAEIKKKINLMTNSHIIEEKIY